MNRWLALPFLSLALCVPLQAFAAPSGYHVLKNITLGGDGGWDYLNIDPSTGNLFITRGTHVLVVDPRTRTGMAGGNA